MVTTDLPFLLQSTCNLVVNLIFMAFTNSGLLIGSQFYWSVLYTAGLALLYLILGTFLFQKRKSETAGQSAPNRRLQAVYRIILVMAYCLPVCVWIVDSEVTSISGFEVFVLYLIAVLIYFFYELLTTKKIKQTLRTAPGLLLVAACNGVLIFGMLPEGAAICTECRGDSIGFHPGRWTVQCSRRKFHQLLFLCGLSKRRNSAERGRCTAAGCC